MPVKGNIYDLSTVRVSLTGSTVGTDLDLGAVPGGRTRFVTYIKVHVKGMSNIVQVGSAPSAASGVSKVSFEQSVDNTYEYPERPDMDSPLFAVASGGYVGARTLVSNVSGTELTLQYFDK